MPGLKSTCLYYFRQLVRHGVSAADDPRRQSSVDNRQAALLAELEHIKSSIHQSMPDNPVLNGFKVYSQVDEDGIIQELLRRLPSAIRNNTAIEIGCGNGTENNTHFLVLNGFRAVWVDGNSENIAFIRRTLALESSDRSALKVEQKFVGIDNVHDIITESCAFLASSDLDFFSIDIDGNDLFVLARAIESCSPKIICTEYNAKFPPPMSASIRYNPDHTWSGDDYHGASLQAFCDMLTGYSLVCCNISGTNAFFIRNDLRECYTIYPITSVYMPFRSRFQFLMSAHPPSLKWLRDAVRPDKK